MPDTWYVLRLFLSASLKYIWQHLVQTFTISQKSHNRVKTAMAFECRSSIHFYHWRNFVYLISAILSIISYSYWVNLFASTVPLAKKLFGGTVPPAKKLFGGTVPPAKMLFGGIVAPSKKFFWPIDRVRAASKNSQSFYSYS